MKKLFLCLATSLYLTSFIFCLRVNAGNQLQDKDFFHRSDTLVKISLHYIKLKDYANAEKPLKAACKIAEKIKEPYSREIILFELSDKYLQINNLEVAYKLAKLIEFSDVKSEVIAKIAYKYTELGDYTSAQKVTKQIEDPFSKAKALYKIVNRLTDLELYNEAIKITKGTEDSHSVIKEVVVVQILERRFVPVGLDSLVRPGQDSFNNPDELYIKSKNLVETANQYFGIYLFEPAKRILHRAAIIAGRIGIQSLRQDVLQKIEVANGKIYGFEKSLNVVK